MAESSDDLGIPMKPARPVADAGERPGQAAGDAAAGARSGATGRAAPPR